MQTGASPSWVSNWAAFFKRLRPGKSENSLDNLLREHAHDNVIDYRDRISVVTWLIILGLGISLFFELPDITSRSFIVFSTPVTFFITDSLIAAAFMSVLAAAGAQSVVGVHPRILANHGSFWQSWAFWALPMALMIIAAYLLPFAPNRLGQTIAILSAGGLYALALFGLYATVEVGQPGFRRSRLILNALAYGSALLLFLLVYQTRTRSLISATMIAVTATLLAVEILRSTTSRVDQLFTYGAIVGIVLGQVTWALNYWPLLPGLTGGLLLLLTFYLLVGIAQQGLQEHFSVRIFVEFLVFTLIALILIAIVGPGY